ncbi:matrixin family metalloprotease [Spirillospora sp. NPDC048911]|uniref:matrixin family metalloprotease n=1 Tax=Spirillospora sp. NPDC048911 TaxID=3364527 RepID=UPI0037218665
MTSLLQQLPKRQASCFTALVSLSLLVPAAGTAAGDAGGAPSWCKGGGSLDAQSLPSSVKLGECDVRSRVIEGAHGLRVAVPPRGSEVVTVTAHVLQSGGSSELTVQIPPGRRMVSIKQQTFTHEDGRPQHSALAQDACRDRSWSSGLSAWPKGSTINWKFYEGEKVRGVPDEKAAVSDGVTRAVDAVTDCTSSKRFDPQPNIHEKLAGTTTAAPNINGGVCSSRDGTNSIGWANMTNAESGTLALSCIWQSSRNIVEGDIAIQSHDKNWWAAEKAGAAGSDSLSNCPAGSFHAPSAVVHEMGHILGLKHVRGRRHSNLTMAPTMKPCDDRASTLGLGDYHGLIALYGRAS